MPKTNPTIIPFEYGSIKKPEIIIHAKINNSEYFPLVLDTGWTNEVAILPKTAKQIAPGKTKNPLKRSQTDALLLEDATLQVRGNSDLKLKNIKVHEIAQWAIDTIPPSAELTGVIGVGVFRDFNLEIDFDARVLRLYDPGIPRKIQATQSVKITRDEHFRPYLDARIDDLASFPMLIDTGSFVTIFNEESIEIPNEAILTATLYIGLRGFSRPITSPLWVVPELVISDFREKDIPAVIVDYPINILGLSTLSRYNLYFDWKERQLYLTKRSSYDHLKHLPGTVGVLLSKPPGQQEWKAHCVFSDSAAFQAGIRPGDTILAVDGSTLPNKNNMHVNEIINGFAGSTVALTIRDRQGRTCIVSLKRDVDSVFRFKEAIRSGFDVRFSYEDYRRTIADVEENSAEYKAGLRNGDRLVAMDGVPIETLSMKAVFALLQKAKTSVLCLTIERQKQRKELKLHLGMVDRP